MISVKCRLQTRLTIFYDDKMQQMTRSFLFILILFLFYTLSASNCTAYKLATGDFSEIQHKVDLLEEKAIAKKQFTDDEKAFLKDLYGSLVFGGRLLGYKEAAHMLEHYLKASGTPLKIDESIYLENKKVRQALHKVRVCINNDILHRTLKSHYYSGTINIGYKENPRLFYFSNVFVLQAKPVKVAESYCSIRWRVELTAHFPSYDEQKQKFGSYHYFRTPFTTNSKGETFTIDDGLSHYLSTVGLAKEFIYYAEWVTGMGTE
jgi:hypothetical protein